MTHTDSGSGGVAGGGELVGLNLGALSGAALALADAVGLHRKTSHVGGGLALRGREMVCAHGEQMRRCTMSVCDVCVCSHQRKTKDKAGAGGRAGAAGGLRAPISKAQRTEKGITLEQCIPGSPIHIHARTHTQAYVVVEGLAGAPGVGSLVGLLDGKTVAANVGEGAVLRHPRDARGVGRGALNGGPVGGNLM